MSNSGAHVLHAKHDYGLINHKAMTVTPQAGIPLSCTHIAYIPYIMVRYVYIGGCGLIVKTGNVGSRAICSLVIKLRPPHFKCTSPFPAKFL